MLICQKCGEQVNDLFDCGKFKVCGYCLESEFSEAQKTIKAAQEIIDMYQMEIRNAEFIPKSQGFCQGSLFRERIEIVNGYNT